MGWSWDWITGLTVNKTVNENIFGENSAILPISKEIAGPFLPETSSFSLTVSFTPCMYSGVRKMVRLAFFDWSTGLFCTFCSTFLYFLSKSTEKSFKYSTHICFLYICMLPNDENRWNIFVCGAIIASFLCIKIFCQTVLFSDKNKMQFSLWPRHHQP